MADSEAVACAASKKKARGARSLSDWTGPRPLEHLATSQCRSMALISEAASGCGQGRGQRPQRPCTQCRLSLDALGIPCFPRREQAE